MMIKTKVLDERFESYDKTLKKHLSQNSFAFFLKK